MNPFQMMWSNGPGELDITTVWFFITMLAQVLIIGYAAIWGWSRIVGTQAERLVKGIIVVAGFWGLFSILQFELITTILQMMLPVAVLALVIIFQPELRRGLGYLGKVNTFKLDLSLTSVEATQLERDVIQIISAVRELSRSKTGALIVIEPLLGERDYVSPGTTVNADISTTLLLTIFFDKSPLHDGAVVIRKNKIVAAGVILPMTDDPELSYRYGTRHRAAIGLSETYDGLCIVVSEETGAISAASRGMLARYKSADDLKEPITYLYTQGGDSKNTQPGSSLLNILSKEPVGAESKIEESDKADNAELKSGEATATNLKALSKKDKLQEREMKSNADKKEETVDDKDSDPLNSVSV